MFGFRLKWDNFHLLSQYINWFLRILEIAIAVCNVNYSLHWFGIILTISFCMRNILFFKIIDSICSWTCCSNLTLKSCQNMICLWNFLISIWVLSYWCQRILYFVYVIGLVSIKVLSSSLYLYLSYLYQWTVVTFIFNKIGELFFCI